MGTIPKQSNIHIEAYFKSLINSIKLLTLNPPLSLKQSLIYYFVNTFLFTNPLSIKI